MAPRTTTSRPSGRRCRLLPLAVGALLAAGGRSPAQVTAGTWERTALPATARWSEFTHALARGETAWFLHGRDVHELGGDGTWRAHPGVLPAAVGPFSAATIDRAGKLLVVPGGGADGFLLDPSTWTSESIPALNLPTRRGCVACVDYANVPYVILGGRHPTWGRVIDGAWEELPAVDTVNPVGAYSAGLFAMPDGTLLAHGDHHVNVYRIAERRWDHKSRLFVQLGFRPAHDRGGMAVQEAGTSRVLMTLGKGSRSVGLMTADRRFFHMRPRLPFLLRDPDRCLYLTDREGEVRLNVLSREQGAIFSIPVYSMVPIGLLDRLADNDSRFEVSNSTRGGSLGDLARERDSACSLIYCSPYVYIQRKMFVRQVHTRTMAHSPPDAGFRYGKEFARESAALCYDGDNAIYVYNGNTSQFWRLEPFTRADGGARQQEQVPLADARVTELPRIPEWDYAAPRDGRSRNTAMTAHDGAVFALFELVSRRLWRFDTETNVWEAADVLPADVPFTDVDGLQLCSDGERLWLLSKDVLVDYSPGEGWGRATRLSFSFSQDGGTLVMDRARGRIYVTIGGGSRDLGVIRLADRRHRLLVDFYPDVVSVPGHRMFLDEVGEETWLYLFRGHDSAEYWRTRISGGGELRVD